MIHEFYLEYWQKYLTESQIKTLKLLISTIQITQVVTLEKLASALPLLLKQNSRRRKLQRFLSNPIMSVPLLWFPLIKMLVKSKFKLDKALIITIDRTQWRSNNILMVSVIYQKRAWPINWIEIDTLGASNLPRQQAVLKPVLKLFKQYRIIILGDREFGSVELAYWLQQKKTNFILREKKNILFASKYQKLTPLNNLEIKPGKTYFYPQIRLTAKPLNKRFNLVVYWRRKYLKNHSKEPWYLLTNLDNANEVKNLYQKRWGIECLFRDLKRGGYQLESTYINQQKLSSLVLLISISLTSVWLQGQTLVKLGYADYLARPKEKSRINKRFSNFSLGLAYFRYLGLYNLYEHKQENIVNSPPSRLTLFPQHFSQKPYYL